MKTECEICRSSQEVNSYEYGGRHPTETFAKPYLYLCRECCETAEQLKIKGKLRFRQGERDTTNSRQSLIKAAVKRTRFGNANISSRDIVQSDQSGANQDFDTLLQRSVLAFYGIFLELTEDITSAWALNEIFFWTKERRVEWYECSLEEWQIRCGVRRRALESAIAQLTQLGVVETRKAGLPLRLSYRINLKTLEAKIRKVIEARERRRVRA